MEVTSNDKKISLFISRNSYDPFHDRMLAA